MLKHGVPMYMSYGTAASHKDPMDGAHIIKAGETLRFGALTVVPFRTFHNTDEPLGFLIEGRPDEGTAVVVCSRHRKFARDRRAPDLYRG